MPCTQVGAKNERFVYTRRQPLMGIASKINDLPFFSFFIKQYGQNTPSAKVGDHTGKAALSGV